MSVLCKKLPFSVEREFGYPNVSVGDLAEVFEGGAVHKHNAALADGSEIGPYENLSVRGEEKVLARRL